MPAPALRLVVIGDSTAFTDDKGPQLPREPHLYPNVVARALEDALDRPVAVSVIARAGSDVREAYRAVIKDRHVMFEMLMGADAVVVAVGSIDHAPAGVPPVLDELVRRIESARLRRPLRGALRAMHPYGVRFTNGRYAHTPARTFQRLYDGVLFQVRALTNGAPGVVLGPTSHRSRYYGGVHPSFDARARMQAAIGRAHGFPVVEAWPIVEQAADRLNPDGIHWPSDVHERIGRALAVPLVEQIAGRAPAPGVPWPA